MALAKQLKNDHDFLGDFLVRAAKEGRLKIPWYCEPPFTPDKLAILRRHNRTEEIKACPKIPAPLQAS